MEVGCSHKGESTRTKRSELLVSIDYPAAKSVDLAIQPSESPKYLDLDITYCHSSNNLCVTIQ